MALLWIFLLALEPNLSFAEKKSAPAARTEVRFEKAKLTIGNQKLMVELAETEAQHAHGLMYRDKLGENEGMLFIFSDSETRSFWMKNTFVDLSIGFFDRNKKLFDIQDMTAVTSTMVARPPSYVSSGPAMYALEVPKGWFNRKKIEVGAVFSLDRGRAQPSERKDRSP